MGRIPFAFISGHFMGGPIDARPGRRKIKKKKFIKIWWVFFVKKYWMEFRMMHCILLLYPIIIMILQKMIGCTRNKESQKMYTWKKSPLVNPLRIIIYYKRKCLVAFFLTFNVCQSNNKPSYQIKINQPGKKKRYHMASRNGKPACFQWGYHRVIQFVLRQFDSHRYVGTELFNLNFPR
jgi:hypothetical protein